MTTDTQAPPKSDPILRMTRTFDAAPERVFAAWTDPEQLTRWWGFWGPDDERPAAEVDLTVGGKFRWAMNAGEGNACYQVGEFTEIDPPRRLAFTFAWEGAEGPATPVVLDFEATDDGKTRMTLTHDLSENANACEEGWGGSFEGLEAYLAEERLTPHTP